MLGLLAGIGLAKGLVALFAAMGVELPDAATVIAPRTIIVSIVVGTVVTLVASILPARRATRVPPIAAVREGATLPPSRFAAASRSRPARHRRGGSLAAMAAGVFAGGLSTRLTGRCCSAAACSGSSLGIALLAPRLVAPLARFVGWPARRVGGVAGELAGANAVRNPGRTASTAAALMIGLTLVTLVAVLGVEPPRRDRARRVTDEVHAGYVVDAQGRPAVPGRRRRPSWRGGRRQARLARPLRQGARRRRGAHVTGIDPATIARFYRFEWSKGSEHRSARSATTGRS